MERTLSLTRVPSWEHTRCKRRLCLMTRNNIARVGHWCNVFYFFWRVLHPSERFRFVSWQQMSDDPLLASSSQVSAPTKTQPDDLPSASKSLEAAASPSAFEGSSSSTQKESQTQTETEQKEPVSSTSKELSDTQTTFPDVSKPSVRWMRCSFDPDAAACIHFVTSPCFRETCLFTDFKCVHWFQDPLRRQERCFHIILYSLVCHKFGFQMWNLRFNLGSSRLVLCIWKFIAGRMGQ